MALGILMILFAVMSAASITGLSLMFAVKNERDRRTVFYCMAVWGMFIAAFGAMSLPANFLAQRASAWGIGILSLAAILIHIKAKDKKIYYLAYGLVAVSVIAGVYRIFF